MNEGKFSNTVSSLFFSNKKYMVLAPCNKNDKEKYVLDLLR